MAKNSLQLNRYSLFIVGAAALWALDGVLRRNVYSLPPITIVFLEHVIGFVLIAPFFFKELAEQKMTKEIWGVSSAIALFSSLLGTLLFTTALLKVQFIPFSVVILLQKLQPLFAVMAAKLLLGERVTKQYLPWAALALVAAFFVTFPNGQVNLNTGNGTLQAAAMAVGAAALWGSSTALSRKLLLQVSETVATGLRFGLTSLMGLVAVMLMGQLPSVSGITFPQLGTLLMIALSTGMVALWLYYKGLQKTEAKVTTILELTFPMLAVFIDMYLYQAFLIPTQYLAAVILLFAMYQVSSTSRSAAETTVIGG